jgi:hypothetical protein
VERRREQEPLVAEPGLGRRKEPAMLFLGIAKAALVVFGFVRMHFGAASRVLETAADEQR